MKILKRIAIAVVSVIVLLVITTFFVIGQPQFGKAPKGEHLETLKNSEQHNGKTFENEGGIDVDMSIGKMIKLLPRFLIAQEGESPSRPVPVVQRKPADFQTNDPQLLSATWFGHSAFLLEIDGKKLFLDPMLGPAAGPFSFMTKRFNDTLPVAIEDLPAIDAVLFSHDHYDHLDYPTILAMKEKVGHFFVPLGLGSHLQHWGVASEKITELDWWQEVEFQGMTLVSTPAQHFSGRSLSDRNATLWTSWVILGKQHRVFFNGDSGYFGGYKKIGEKYGPFDLCMVECGQYNEQWSEIHMMPEQTHQAFLDLQGEVLMPIHWGMFDLALHHWTDPIERVMAAAEKAGSVVATPRVGESIIIGRPIPSDPWWKAVDQVLK